MLIFFLKIDQNGEVTENCNSCKLNENEEKAVLIDCVAPEIEKPNEREVAIDDLEEGKEKDGPGLEEDFPAAPRPLKSPRTVGPTSTTAPAQVFLQTHVFTVSLHLEIELYSSLVFMLCIFTLPVEISSFDHVITL